jgi:hypothetical protein
MRPAGPAAILAAALLLAAAAAADAPVRPPPGRATPTLRAAGGATGGGWSEAQVRRYAAAYDLVVVGASARAERVRLFHQARPGILVLAYTCGFDVHQDAPLFAWIRDRRPGWFLRDAAGRPIHTYRDAKRWALDCGRDDVRAFFADSARRRVRELGADGILEDNVLPSWDYRNLAAGAARLERYATVAEWRAALERYLEALERAVAPAVVGANEVLPWTRHARIVAVEQLPPGGPRWEEMLRGFAALARDSARVPYLQQHLDGPRDPMRAFATASYLLVVEPGALLSLQWDGPREAVVRLPEYRLALGRPLGAARQAGGVWWRDFERARVLVNPSGQERPAPWPAWSGPVRAALPARGAGIAWRTGAPREPLPGWVTP